MSHETSATRSPGTTANRPAEQPKAPGEPLGLFYAWWRGDPWPPLPSLSGLTIEPAEDERLVAGLAGADPESFRERIRQGHRPWLAWVAGEPVGCGWVATREAAIGELGLTLVMTLADRYLWDFVTLPAWRGRRIYPALLQAIIRREVEAARFWVGHDLDNVASGRGILRAGFGAVGAVHRLPGGELIFVASVPGERATAAAAILGLSQPGSSIPYPT